MTKSDRPIEVVGVHEAKTSLSRLLRLTEEGVDVQITRGHMPVARLVAIRDPSARRRLGTLSDSIWIADDFDEPLTGVEREIESNDLFPA